MAAILKFFGLGKTTTSHSHPALESSKDSKWNSRVVTKTPIDSPASSSSITSKMRQTEEKEQPKAKENRTDSLSSSGSFDFEAIGFPNPNSLGASSESHTPEAGLAYMNNNAPIDHSARSLSVDDDFADSTPSGRKSSDSSLTPGNSNESSPEATKKTEPKGFTRSQAMDFASFGFPDPTTLGDTPPSSAPIHNMHKPSHDATFMIFDMEDV